MPDGAQAWKMIKTPGTHTDRIAQACDRCRSKKIRCDGLRPHCSQCLAVGFECKISDKLTRRAFPRGYTESLEDRIRQLEADNSRLSNLLDVKDEQMEMLSRVEAVHENNNNGGPSAINAMDTSTNTSTSSPNVDVNRPGSIGSIPTLTPDNDYSQDEDEDEIIVNHMNNLGADGTYRGTSAGGVFVNSFIQKLKTKNPTVLEPVQRITAYFTQTTQGGLIKSALKTSHESSYSYNSDLLLSPPGSSSDLFENSQLSSLFPSRLSCDKLVTVYFQEWQSVYTVVDQSKFLDDYQKFLEEEKNDELYAATLALVLGLACLSNKEGSSLTISEIWKLDSIWKRILSQKRAPSLQLLQALTLAQLYSLHVGNLDDVWHYRTLTTSMSLRLGYHLSRKAIRNAQGEPLTVYERELTRRVFWVVYTLDVFSSAVLGSPRLFNDNQIQCAMPKYIDEEVVTDSFVTPPPNSPENDNNSNNSNSNTPASCQVSFMIFSRILANILDTVYSPKKLSHRAKTIIMLEDQLESWHRDLPPSLKFEFVNGMPTASLSPVHQKSPLLLMLYHYARVLIHFPATGGEETTSGSSSIVAVMQSAKTYLQIFNYLKARNVTSTLPLSPTRMMFLFGSVILYCAIDYSKGGALLQQSRKLISQGLGYLYNDMQAGLPGSISGECFQWLEEICDSILNGSPQSRKTSNSGASGKPKEKKRSQSEVQMPQVKIETLSPPSQQQQQSQPSPSYQQIIIPQQPTFDTNTALLATANLMGVPLQLHKYNNMAHQQQQQQHQQPTQSYYQANMNNTVVNILPTSPVEDFFDTSSFEDFDISTVLDPTTIKTEPVQNTNTNTFLDNFNWDDSYNWSTMTV